MDIYFGSENTGKIAEVLVFLKKNFTDSASKKLQIKTLSNIDVDLKKKYQPQESGVTFSENALIKAQSLYQLLKQPVFAEDSGLEVEALQGAPGIYSSRYGENDADRMDRVLTEMRGVKNRRAHFVTALCFIAQDMPIYFYGRVEGEISQEPVGLGGFGYDPIFLFQGKSFAELEQSQKTEISHRGLALKNFFAYLQAWVLEQNKKQNKESCR